MLLSKCVDAISIDTLTEKGITHDSIAFLGELLHEETEIVKEVSISGVMNVGNWRQWWRMWPTVDEVIFTENYIM